MSQAVELSRVAWTELLGLFAQFPGNLPEHATPEDVQSFQLHLIEVRKVGLSSFNQVSVGGWYCLRATAGTARGGFELPLDPGCGAVVRNKPANAGRRTHLGSTPSPIDWLPVG